MTAIDCLSCTSGKVSSKVVEAGARYTPATNHLTFYSRAERDKP